jgi:2,4-dihydroxyhept-2-ene-1,7-dioic acid aldolase
MFTNKLKGMLSRGESAIGTFAAINSPDVIELLAIAGYDFVIIDCEHGPMDAEASTNLIRAAEAYGMTPLARVRCNSETVILKHLDVGAHGVQIPQINTADDARNAVRFSKYHPEGKRGVALPRASGFGMFPIDEYFRQENAETLVVVHCENTTGLENLEEIAQVPGVDVIFLGPFDMSQSMGIPGQVGHPRIEAAAERVLEVCAQYGKVPGIFVGNAEAARKRRDQGFRYLPISVDCTTIGGAFKAVVDAAKA